MNCDDVPMTAQGLFQILCRYTADIPFCYDPKIYSIGWLSELIGKSKYMVRKWMKELEAEGLVCRAHEGGSCDDEPWVWCYHGWSITDKARETAVYKQEEIEAGKRFKEIMYREAEDNE